MEWLTSVQRFFKDKRRKKFLKFGVPFLAMVICSSFAMEKFQILRFEMKQGSKMLEIEKEILSNQKLKKKKQSDQEMIEDMLKRDIDTWTNLRVPQEGEDSKAMQDAQREELKKQAKENSI